MDVSEAELQGLYTWVDEIPLSRPKRNIARDFSDGVLFAEVVAHYFPRLVDLHNYSAANNTAQKMYNWNTMNQKVFKRLGFSVAKQDFEAIANCQPGAIERLLKLAKIKIAKFKEEGGAGAFTAPAVPRVANLAHHHSEQHMGGQAPSGYTQNGGDPMGAAQRAHAHSQAHAHANVLMTGRSEAAAEKDHTLNELRETNEILETKVRKMEQLVRLKDSKIATLMGKLQAAGIS